MPIRNATDAPLIWRCIGAVATCPTTVPAVLLPHQPVRRPPSAMSMPMPTDPKAPLEGDSCMVRQCHHAVVRDRQGARECEALAGAPGAHAALPQPIGRMSPLGRDMGEGTSREHVPRVRARQLGRGRIGLQRRRPATWPSPSTRSSMHQQAVAPVAPGAGQRDDDPRQIDKVHRAGTRQTGVPLPSGSSGAAHPSRAAATRCAAGQHVGSLSLRRGAIAAAARPARISRRFRRRPTPRRGTRDRGRARASRGSRAARRRRGVRCLAIGCTRSSS